MEYISHYASPLGVMTMGSDGTRLLGLWFEGQRYFAATLTATQQEQELPVFAATKQWLDIYFGGGIPDFTPPLLLQGTEFRRAVWELLLQLPYGSTVTYGELAQTLAKQRGVARLSAQAVGGAVGHNPFTLIIPCHRVIGAQGSLTGYAGGLDKKQQLLALEQGKAI